MPPSASTPLGVLQQCTHLKRVAKNHATITDHNTSPQEEIGWKLMSPAGSDDASLEENPTAKGKWKEKRFRSFCKMHSSMLSAAIQDCYGRFILNLPQQSLSNYIQLCFSIQEAYWWYDDYWFDNFTPLLPKMSMRRFGVLLCKRCPLLKLYFGAERYESFMEQWRAYCKTIPLKGAILVNNTLTKVLMVQTWRGGHWMFPRGKVDELEEDIACAVREVKEEIGVDISNMIHPHMYIETSIAEQPIKLYVIPGVLEFTHFKPRKRKEIGQIKWIPVDAIPGWTRFYKERIQLMPSECNKKFQNVKSLFPHDSLVTSDGGGQRPERLMPGRIRFWNVHPFTESLVGWLYLVQLGLKPKNVPQPLSAGEWLQNIKLQQKADWTEDETHSSVKERYRSVQSESCDVQSTGCLLTFDNDEKSGDSPQRASPFSKERKEKQVPLSVETTSLCEKSTGGKPLAYIHPIGLPSLCVRQPAEAKPAPLPPLVDPMYRYELPTNVPPDVIERLQHPTSYPTRQRSFTQQRKPQYNTSCSNRFHDKKAVIISSSPRSEVSSSSSRHLLVSSDNDDAHSYGHQGQLPFMTKLSELRSITANNGFMEKDVYPSVENTTQVTPESTPLKSDADLSYAKKEVPTGPLPFTGRTSGELKSRSILWDLRQLGLNIGNCAEPVCKSVNQNVHTNLHRTEERDKRLTLSMMLPETDVCNKRNEFLLGRYGRVANVQQNNDRECQEPRNMSQNLDQCDISLESPFDNLTAEALRLPRNIKEPFRVSLQTGSQPMGSCSPVSLTALPVYTASKTTKGTVSHKQRRTQKFDALSNDSSSAIECSGPTVAQRCNSCGAKGSKKSEDFTDGSPPIPRSITIRCCGVCRSNNSPVQCRCAAQQARCCNSCSCYVCSSKFTCCDVSRMPCCIYNNASSNAISFRNILLHTGCRNAERGAGIINTTGSLCDSFLRCKQCEGVTGFFGCTRTVYVCSFCKGLLVPCNRFSRRGSVQQAVPGDTGFWSRSRHTARGMRLAALWSSS